VVGPRGGCGIPPTTRTTKWQYVAFTKKRISGDAKRSGSETRKRGPKVDFRVTDDERARIAAAASRAGLTVGSYCRARALTKPTTRAVRRAPVETAQLAQLLALLGAAGGALQRLSASPALDGSGDRENLGQAIGDFREAAAAILRALGKRA
jgi:hypothetical protein